MTQLPINSASNLGSNTVDVPTCDVWGNWRLDPGLFSGVGVNSVPTKTSAGLHRIDVQSSFRSRLGGGGYVILYTPEVRSETCMLSSNRASGSTAAASTTSFDISTWRFLGPVGAGGNTATQADFPANSTWVNFALFSLSKDSQLGVPAGGTYSLVPGASGYGISGATYFSCLTNALSSRSATSYGTIVLPPARSNSTAFNPYLENSYNANRVRAVSGGPEYDVFFERPMGDTYYCVLLCAESEHFHLNDVAGIPNINEYTLPIVIRGNSDEFKTTSSFRIRNIKQNASNNAWTSGNFASMQSGLYERIHFMVFGGFLVNGVTYGTYRQP
jgi:hypothetical protein